MRVVSRRHTRRRVVHPLRRSTDYPNVDQSGETLMKRFKALQPGESLYPWANTKLAIVNGKRRWIAKGPEDE